MKIRKAKLKDIPECVKLSKVPEFKIGGSFPDKKYLTESLKSLFLVAEEKGKILGFVLGFKLTRTEVFLDLLVVDKNARGEGIGKKLMEGFRKRLKKQNVEGYFLTAPMFNKKTHKFYNKCGLKKGGKYILFYERFNY